MLLAALLIMVGICVKAQSIDKIVDSKVAAKSDSLGTVIKIIADRVALVESKLNSGVPSGSVEYDTTFVFSSTTLGATPLSIDTLTGSTNLYEITYAATNPNTGDIGSGRALVTIKLYNGTYTVVRTVNIAAWSGQGTLGSCKLAVVKVNSLPVVQLTGTAGTTIKWTITKNKLL